MFHPLSLYVGLRYVRARSHKFFVSFITWASLSGVCVGVAALIVILSVMNGFESELRERLLALGSDVRVVTAAGESRAGSATFDWGQAARVARGVAGVRDVAPYAELQALAVHQPEMMPVVLRGIEPTAAATVADIGAAITQGHLADLAAGSARVIVGAVIAERLGLSPGEALTLLVPSVSADARRSRSCGSSRWPECSRWARRTRTRRWCSRISRTCGRSRASAPPIRVCASGWRTCWPRRASRRACERCCPPGSRCATGRRTMRATSAPRALRRP